MKTARRSQEVSWTPVANPAADSGGQSSSASAAAAGHQQPHVVVDAYAQNVLEEQASAAGQPAPDESLGGYVTSVLRLSDASASSEVTDIPEYDGLIELLQEHCGCEEQSSAEALERIARAVRTGSLPLQFSERMSGLRSMHALVTALPSDPTTNNDESTTPQVISPLHADNLLPVHLLDDPSEALQQPQPEEKPESVTLAEDAFPPLGLSPAPSTRKPPARTGSHSKITKAKQQDATELAAALFRPARSRQSSIDETSPDLQPQPAPPDHSMQQLASVEENMQYNSAMEILLSMNADLSEEAAYAAALQSQADVNLAQYLVDTAAAQPPICRHLLSAGCYRSDCQFSHDVAGHTCIFWLRGRCGKGEACRFLHGFDDKILQEVGGGEMSAPGYASSAASNQADYPYPAEVGYQDPISSYPMSGYGLGNSACWAPPTTAAESSFANVASHGFGTTSYANSGDTAASSASHQQMETVKIPHDLWNPHENRDAGVFYISDPIERYNMVASTVKRDDVIDLHFQSTKTFPTVLSRVLPEKLQRFDEVWIVTGTGHHVGSNTHQKGGGLLERSVIAWLTDEGYYFARGRDRTGQGGAILVKR